MSTCLSYKNGVKARKRYRCVLCGKSIDVGSLYDIRKGIGEGFWSMRMHQECHYYELNSDTFDRDRYEDTSEPAFDRTDALAAFKLKTI